MIHMFRLFIFGYKINMSMKDTGFTMADSAADYPEAETTPELRAKIVRIYRKSGRRKVLFPNVSLTVARLHTNDKGTSTKTYMDVYYLL